MPLITIKLDQKKVEDLHELIISDLELSGLRTGEAIVGLLAVLATQYNGGILEPEPMREFIDHATKYFSAYFASPVKQ